ncbi:MAG TPA: 5'-3' exonuclease H3TH domain-containing protein [Terriglobales bacterium]|nr:5'-3' exonuclease H3TH domain-containing protein [Terriglobales bacterium]
MPQLFLIDATYELFRAYFAMPKEAAPDGQEIGAIRGLLSSIGALLRQPEVTHVAAATDHVIESFRNDLYPGYKTGAGIAPDLLSQFPLAEEALRCLGVVVWPMVEFEADDALATAAARFADQVERVVICSPDKDLCQCVRDPCVVTLDRRRNRTYDEAAVIAKFGVPPRLIADWLALVGDSADGYPGLRGWGKKTAAAVLNEFGSIEAIPADWRLWRCGVRGGERLAQALASERELALLFKQLAVLRTDVPLTESLADLRWVGPDEARWQALRDRAGWQK